MFEDERKCTFCNESSKNDLVFTDEKMERWKLKPPMHLECALEALIEKKIKEKMEK